MAEWLTAGASLLGAAGGSFGSGGQGGGSTRQSFNSTTSSQPWSMMAPYLTGGTMPDGSPVPGIFPEAGRLYNSTGFSDPMRTQQQNWFNDTINNRNVAMGSGTQNIGGDILKGYYDPRITAAGPIAGAPTINPQSVDPTSARGNMGELDPTGALKGFLYGSVNPFVDQAGKAITDTATRNLMENVMPGIRSGAIASGQYGGNKDAQAEAMAISRMNTDLAPALAQLGLSAWDSNENRRYGTATGLNQQALDVATGNANRKLQADTVTAGNLLDTQKFNTGTTLANNTQTMQQAAQNVGNRMTGLNALGTAQGLTDNYYGDLLKTLNIPNDYDWSNLGRYAGIIQPSAELFKTTTTQGTSTGQQPMYGGSPIAGAIGGGISGLALGNQVFGRGGIFSRGGDASGPAGGVPDYYSPGGAGYNWWGATY